MIYLENLTKAYYKSGEVAKMLGVTTRTVQNYCINHKLNEIIINNRRLIPKESLVDYLDNVGLLVRDDKTISEELAEDIISIIHSFSGKLYEMRRKVREALDEEVKDDDTC